MPDEPASRSRALCERELVLIDRVRRVERRALAAQIVSVVGHFIGTPLNVIAGRAALIRRDPNPASIEENVHRIEEQVERLAQRIRRLIEYLAAAESEIDLRPAGEVMADAVALTAPVATYRGVSLQTPAEGLSDPVDGLYALAVLTSLLSLAANVAPSGSAVAFGASSEPSCVRFRLVVPGMIPPETRIDRFEPPADRETNEPETLQTLTLCSALAQKSGGRVEIAAEGSSKATITFSCPIR
jgi:signal transduction histidine kinase